LSSTDVSMVDIILLQSVDEDISSLEGGVFLEPNRSSSIRARWYRHTSSVAVLGSLDVLIRRHYRVFYDCKFLRVQL
jgi:hypothetical protein